MKILYVFFVLSIALVGFPLALTNQTPASQTNAPQPAVLPGLSIDVKDGDDADFKLYGESIRDNLNYLYSELKDELFDAKLDWQVIITPLEGGRVGVIILATIPPQPGSKSIVMQNINASFEEGAPPDFVARRTFLYLYGIQEGLVGKGKPLPPTLWPRAA